MTMQWTTWDECLRDLKRLRQSAAEAQHEFMCGLWAAEQQPHLWRATGKTFLQVIEGLVKPARYDAWKELHASHGELVRHVDTAALPAMLKLDEPAQRNVLERARKAEEINGVRPSEQMAKDYIAKEQHVALGRTHAPGYPQLLAENARLKQRIAELESENAALKAERAAALAATAAAKSAGRKRVRQ